MHRGIGFLMHLDFVAIGKRHAQFPLNRLFRLGEEAGAKRAVPVGLLEEAFQWVERLHDLGDLPFDEFLEHAVNGHEFIEGTALHDFPGLHDVDSIGLFKR